MLAASQYGRVRLLSGRIRLLSGLVRLFSGRFSIQTSTCARFERVVCLKKKVQLGTRLERGLNCKIVVLCQLVTRVRGCARNPDGKRERKRQV